MIRVRQPEQEANDNLDLADFYNTSGKWSAAFNYDALGNLRRATDANGVNIINEYDQAKRPIKRCYTKPNISTSAISCASLSSTQLSENTPTVTNLYDGFMEVSQPPTASPNYAKGKLTKVSSSVSETRYTQYNNLGQLVEMQQITDGQTFTSSYQYNFAGVLAQETYPSGRVVKNEFESDGDLRKVFGQANQNAIERTYLNNLSYTALGGIERLKLGNGKWETAKFNERLQITELGLGNGANDASLWKVNYEYGELEANGTVNLSKNTGNIARQTLSFAGLNQPIVQAYKYDSLYRITEAKETSNSQQNWLQQFGYDRFGNRTGFNEQIGNLTNTQTPQIDPNTNRFITTNQNFVYDKNGNLITDGEGRTFIFNGENKQAEVKNPSGVTVGKYYYDGEGKRIKKVTETEITIFIYSGGKLVAEYSTATPPQNPTTKYLTEDHLGTPRIITDGSGNVMSRRDFMPFGEELATTVGERGTTGLKYGVTDGIRQKFTGYQKDTETSLDFAEARMYENRHGRFTAVDPLLASGNSTNPQTFNRYVYVLNSPLISTDPTGLCGKNNPCPKTWDGAVYIATDANGDVWYNNEIPEKSELKWSELPLGTDLLITVEGSGIQLRVFNFGEGSNGGRGWYQIEEGSKPSFLSSILSNNNLGQPFLDIPIDRSLIDRTPRMGPGEFENSSASRLAFEYFTGTGPSYRQFGPDSDMTKGMMTSPMLEIHRQRFITQGGGFYDSENYARINNDYPPSVQSNMN